MEIRLSHSDIINRLRRFEYIRDKNQRAKYVFSSPFIFNLHINELKELEAKFNGIVKVFNGPVNRLNCGKVVNGNEPANLITRNFTLTLIPLIEFLSFQIFY